MWLYPKSGQSLRKTLDQLRNTISRFHSYHMGDVTYIFHGDQSFRGKYDFIEYVPEGYENV